MQPQTSGHGHDGSKFFVSASRSFFNRPRIHTGDGARHDELQSGVMTVALPQRPDQALRLVGRRSIPGKVRSGDLDKLAETCNTDGPCFECGL
jgi:hypothetical protein